jgi:hypothetical protein
LQKRKSDEKKLSRVVTEAVFSKGTLPAIGRRQNCTDVDIVTPHR